MITLETTLDIWKRKNLAECAPYTLSGSQLDLSDQSPILGLIAHPIKHSLSPVMHNAAISAIGLDLYYVPFHILPGRLSQAISGFRALKVTGINVGIPYKIQVLEFLDDLAMEAREIGAVNTISYKDGKLIGHNTDAYGFLAAIQASGISLLPDHCLVMGAGGGARAVVYALGKCPEVKIITVVNRTKEKAEDLARQAKTATGKDIRIAEMDFSLSYKFLREVGLVVNATSIGMASENPSSSIPNLYLDAFTKSDLTFFDLVYTPIETQLMSQFRRIGAKVISGIDMLVYQGIHSFRIWTGFMPSFKIMKETLLNQLLGQVR